jgi:hypothetical protein
MEFCIFGFIALIWGIVWLVQHQSDQELECQIQQASKEGNSRELRRLNSIRLEREQKKHQAQRENRANQRYMDAMIALDAAEHGVFVPNPEEVFDHLEEDPGDDYENYPDEEDDYNERYHDEY